MAKRKFKGNPLYVKVKTECKNKGGHGKHECHRYRLRADLR